ncbi:MAG TPA: ABC transporter substrate-binding protein [Tepidisphaeraceae bacterium]|jgi:arabinosaccharide transport system substrate-binding protein
MSFHLGKPILVMLLIAALSGAFIAVRPNPPKTDLVLWTFTDIHADTYRSIISQFEKQTGKTVSIQHLTSRAENVRLESIFMTGQDSPEVLPDVVEIEIGQVGKFFRPPIDEIGLLPLNDHLKRGGWDQRLVPTRVATWSKNGVVFGVPHDVHPVSITYRDDLFKEAGIDLSQAKTWPEFQEMALRFQEYWRAHGYPTRHAIELPEGSSDYLIVMLLQRGVNIVDQNQVVHINDPIVAKTLAFYAQLVAGDRAIASEAAGGSGVWANDAVLGNLCAFITADWRIFNFRKFAPQLEGKLRMMPLPKFDPSDSPTATWGGTMIGITRNSKHHDDAWKLIEFLYFSQAGLDARLKVTDIIPPVMDQWSDPAFHRADPYFGGQKVQELYLDLAPQVRPRYVTPVTPIAQSTLSVVVNYAVRYVKQNGTNGLEEACQKWLNEAAEDLKARIEHDRFE